MFRFLTVKHFIFSCFVFNTFLVHAAENTNQSPPYPINRGSGREEIALVETQPPGYRRYEHTNAWDYRTKWSNETTPFFKGELDMQNEHPNYGTGYPNQYPESYYNQYQIYQNYPSHQNYPSSQGYQNNWTSPGYPNSNPYSNPYSNPVPLGPASNYQNYYQGPYPQNSGYQNNYRNPSSDYSLVNKSGNNSYAALNSNQVYNHGSNANSPPTSDVNHARDTSNNTNAGHPTNTAGKNTTVSNANTPTSHRPQRSWNYRHNWIDQRDAYLKGEEQVSYNRRIRNEKLKADVKNTSTQIADASSDLQQKNKPSIPENEKNAGMTNRNTSGPNNR